MRFCDVERPSTFGSNPIGIAAKSSSGSRRARFAAVTDGAGLPDFWSVCVQPGARGFDFRPCGRFFQARGYAGIGRTAFEAWRWQLAIPGRIR